MLSFSEQLVIENFAMDFVNLIKEVIKTRPIKRISRRKVNGKYIDKAFSAPVNASGALANSINYVINDNGFSVYANDYIYDLVFGKAPAKTAMSVDINLESKIRSWMDYKGIKSESGNDDTLGYYITRKIQKFGSSIYLAHQGKNSGLLENILSQQLINAYNSKFTSELEKNFKQIFING